MRYTALDFETANRLRTSACAIGLSVCEEGAEVGHFYTLIRPEPCEFDWFCTRVHGIGERDVQDAPTFAEIYPLIAPMLAGDIVCHNAPFDIGCLKALCDAYGLEKPQAEVHCTLKLARRLVPGKSHRLDAVAEHFGLGGFRHHNALDDARICAGIFGRFIMEIGDSVRDHSSRIG